MDAKKYVKPVGRNMGDFLPDALGICGSGTGAGGANVTCLTGDIYNQQTCDTGLGAQGNCNNGSIAEGSQCVEGSGFTKN